MFPKLPIRRRRSMGVRRAASDFQSDFVQPICWEVSMRSLLLIASVSVLLAVTSLQAQENEIAPPHLENHDIPKEFMSAAMELLNAMVKQSPGIRVQMAGPTRVLVHADYEVHLQIRDRLVALTKQPDK